MLSVGALSCREAVHALGPSAATAQTHANQMFGAFTTRYTNVDRAPKYAGARKQIGRAALIPSRVFNDSSVWTELSGDSERTLSISGTHRRQSANAGPRNSYLLAATHHAMPRPLEPGNSRHTIRLSRTGDSQYAWDTAVDFSLGSVTANDVAAAVTALLGAPEGRTSAELRREVHTAFPRATEMLGRAFTMDSVRWTSTGDATATIVMFSVHPERLKEWHPEFANYLDKYLEPARYHLTLRDASGATWFDVQGRDGIITASYRSLRGRLLPSTGPVRPIPDTLQLITDWTMKIGFFRVGVKQLVSDFILTNTEHERAWTIVSRKEPQWELPLAAEHLIRSSLRRPFAGDGALFTVGVHDRPGDATLISRRVHLDVQESAILRFLSKLSSHAVNEFDERAEREEEAFLSESFAALQQDARALLGGQGVSAGPY